MSRTRIFICKYQYFWIGNLRYRSFETQFYGSIELKRKVDWHGKPEKVVVEFLVGFFQQMNPSADLLEMSFLPQYKVGFLVPPFLDTEQPMSLLATVDGCLLQAHYLPLPFWKFLHSPGILSNKCPGFKWIWFIFSVFVTYLNTLVFIWECRLVALWSGGFYMYLHIDFQNK